MSRLSDGEIRQTTRCIASPVVREEVRRFLDHLGYAKGRSYCQAQLGEFLKRYRGDLSLTEATAISFAVEFSHTKTTPKRTAEELSLL